MAILPLFPELELISAHIDGGRIVVTLKNVGAFTIATRIYGQPEYRLIAKLFDGDVQLFDQWLALPCDLAPGATAVIHTKAVAAATALQTLKLYHALQDVPMLEPEPWSEVHVR